MTPAQWKQVDRLFHEALERPPEHRSDFLKQTCNGDEVLFREVESLLSSHEQAGSFIEKSPSDIAAQFLADEKHELPPGEKLGRYEIGAGHPVAERKSLVGRQIGPYQIVARIGAGGMGEVYRATDTRLNRTVAIKVLSAHLSLQPDLRKRFEREARAISSDPERKRRFIQEARAASALNHPNIITVYDIGSEGGIDFVVMEYVAGKTLDQLIGRKGMKLNEALKLAIQMTDALVKAHSSGIIHRDLKPGNVMVTEDGVAKVLDFGLAKLTEVVRPGGETRTIESLTEEGMIIGTVSYMSPEQAEGKKVDARSDIFSFGTVLYEMISGQKAFEGDTKMSALSAILKQEPKPLSQVVPGLPSDLEKIINRCLRKDPERRYQYMADLKINLQELKEESDSGTLAGAPPLVRSTRRTWIWVGAALVVMLVAVATWFFRGTARKPAVAPVPEVIPLTSYAGSENSPSFSPDGNQVVFSWNGEKQDNFDIYVKLVGTENAVRLTTDPADDYSPAFSTDGRSIGFVRVSKQHRAFIIIPSIGGPERIVADLPESVSSFAWLPDSKWVVTDGLTLMSTESGETRALTSPPTKSIPDSGPAVSPDGRMVAFSRSSAQYASDIFLLDLNEQMKPKGEPRRLTYLKGWNAPGAWTPNGLEIVFRSFSWGPGWSLWRVSTSGGEPEKLPYTGPGAAEAAISRNGNRLAYSQDESDANIWHVSLSGPGVASGPPAKLIGSTRWENAPQYSPDGKRIAFSSNRSGVYGLWISDADGSHATELFARPGSTSASAHWSPDGQRIAFSSNWDIYVIRASGGKPICLTTDPAEDDAPSWSRDGNWIYFASKRTGQYEVWKVPAAGGEAVRVTRKGGGPALESPDGKSIYYINGEWSGSLWKMPLSGGEETRVLPSVNSRAFALVKEGIYFIPEPKPDGKFSIEFLNLETGQTKAVIPVSSPVVGLSLSSDGRSLLFTQMDEAGSDLVRVENFH